ncbi:hypothetical protein BDR22DRAFT_859260 [Usnea florida]
MSQKRMLVIGVSDSSGAIGIEAGQKIIAAHGCYAVTATTALRAQNFQSVYQTFGTPTAFVENAIEACFDEGGVEVVQIGEIESAETVQVVVDALRRHGPRFVVVDPVRSFTRESHSSSDEAQRIYHSLLLPLTTMLILSIPEALMLLKKAGAINQPNVRNLDDIVRLTKTLHSHGPQYILLKGGHLPLTQSLEVPNSDSDKQIIVDVLYDGTDVSLFKTPCITSEMPFGAGHAFAAAIASHLARGDAVLLATQKACRYVEATITNATRMTNCFHSTYSLPFSPGYFIEYLLSREDVKPVWHTHVHHDFVKRIGDGTLPIEKFQKYLIQDYLFLVQFARAKAVSAYKTNSMQDIAADAEVILHIKREMSLHLDYCAEFGLSKMDIEQQEEHQACTAYTRYVLDIAHSESWFALQLAFAPCLLGYGRIAKRLSEDSETVKLGPKNKYWKWIQNYVADDYTNVVRDGEAALEKHAVLQSPSQLESLVKIFVHATKMETGFWDMGSA